MRVKAAQVAFKRMNCAQAILHAYADLKGISPERIAAAKAMGGGKAEGGICGAAAAAMELTDEAGCAAITEAFQAASGSVVCREIRKSKTLSCRECVALAAKVLQDIER